ncbi:MAG: PAS domain S-box protein [candidate division Zixibacteria bacterium]|nr:PAS domain S-box protein [candidate division Zixibacteria bacterium]
MYQNTQKAFEKFVADHKPGLMVRLSHLIIVQVAFVFAAFILIVLYPSAQGSWSRDTERLTAHLKVHESQMLTVMGDSNGGPADSLTQARAEVVLGETMAVDKGIVLAQLRFHQSDGESLECWYRPDTTAAVGQDLDILCEVRAIDDRQLWGADLHGRLIPLELDNERILYGYSFGEETGNTALLLFVWEHNLLVSDRSAMLYALLILFLGATLSALLMVYLIIRRFNHPYRLLLHGLEQTAQGEMYFEIKGEGEQELDRVRTAFNQISRTLWDDQQKMAQYDHRLKDATVSLKESQILLGTIIENSPVGVVASDLNGSIIIFNRKASELFGYSIREAMGSPLETIFDRAVDSQTDEEKSTDSESGFEIVGRRKDDSHFPAYLISLPLAAGDGSPIAQLYMVRDITESKRFQEMMIRLDRFYNRGRMSGEIAHEINNHLSVLSGNLELLPLAMARGEQEKTDRNLQQMREAVERINRFSDGLMDSNQSVQGDVTLEVCDVNQLVENVITFLKPQNRFDRVTIDTRLSTSVPLVQIDAAQVQQVLVNLVDNAAEAICDSGVEGHIVVSTATTVICGERAACIEVSDNGPGVPSDKVDRLFEHRFTTKLRGNGIGLVTCRKILDGHNGQITYAYDQGAIFTLCLPVWQSADFDVTSFSSTLMPSA